MAFLVSIIIPTFNRADLIIETLNSIKEQTYKHWECLVVDDGSTDDSLTLLTEYQNLDERFKIFKRPYNALKGANTCRNIGLENALGDYIVFFDSDDLMTPNHLELKIKAIEDNACDYVITKTTFFNHPKQNSILEKQYQYATKDINAYNYISHKINWQTPDLCIESNLAKSISFNEKLQSGQEYNYFSKLTLLSTNASFIKEIVTLRRYHDHSIRGDLRSNKIMTLQSYLNTYWQTYLDTQQIATKAIKQFLVYRCFRLLYKLPKSERLFTNQIQKAILKEFKVKGIYYLLKLQLERPQ